MSSTTKKLRAGLKIEALEDRLALSVSSATLSGGMIYVNGNNLASNVSVYKSGSDIVVSDSANGFSKSFASAGVSKLQFVGGAADDRLVSTAWGLEIRAWGYGGNDHLEGYNVGDTLVGGIGNDKLYGNGGADDMWGSEGNDELRGGAGADDLYGGAGSDQLFGEAGKDYLSGQGGMDYFNGGSEFDKYRDEFGLNSWVLGGYNRLDVDQGQAGTCVINAALAEAAHHINMAPKVTRTGNNYKVRLVDGGKFVYQNVYFDGTYNDNDTKPTQTRGSDGGTTGYNKGEFWTVLYQRAFLKLCGTNTTSENSDNWTSSKYNYRDHKRALYALSGWSTSQRNISSSTSTATAQAMRNDCLAGKMMTAGGTGHAYSVVSVFQDDGVWKVKLYNPWGSDATHQTMSFANGELADDGVITLNWSVFRSNFTRVYTAAH